MLRLSHTIEVNKKKVEVTHMTDKPKEKVFAERQDNYKQEKEEIFKEALKDYHEEPSGETIENDESKA